MKRKITVTGANKLFFVFTILFIIFQFVLMAVASFKGEDFINKHVYAILFTNQYILILIPVITYVLINRLNFFEVFRIRRLELYPAVLIVFITILGNLAASMLNNIIIYFLQFIGNVPNSPIPVPNSFSELLIGIGIIAVSPAICEEFLHRGIMLSAYEQRGSIKAVFISAIFFGIFHFDITNFLGAVFMGIIIGYVVIRTNSIFAGMLIHFLNNSISELVIFFDKSSDSQQKNQILFLDDLKKLILVGILSMIFIWLLLKPFNRLTEKTAFLRAPISDVKGDIVSIVTHWPIIVILCIYIILAILTVYML